MERFWFKCCASRAFSNRIVLCVLVWRLLSIFYEHKHHHLCLNSSDGFPASITSNLLLRWHWLGVTCSNRTPPHFSLPSPLFLSLISLAARSQSACDSPPELRLYFTVSGLRHRHVLIKIQIPCIDCVIRRPQPRPGSIDPPCDLWSFSEEKSFCVIIWGNSLGRV